MALEKTFRKFSTGVRRLLDRLEELKVTVVEDRPSRNDAVIVDTLEYAVEDLLGWLRETLQAADKAERAVVHPRELNDARRELTRCQEQFHRVEQEFGTNLVSYERVKNLTSFGKERRGEWPSWVTSVKQGIDQCRQPLQDAGKALAECWQELAEHAGIMTVSVQTTNIGQHITESVAGEKATVHE